MEKGKRLSDLTGAWQVLLFFLLGIRSLELLHLRPNRCRLHCRQSYCPYHSGRLQNHRATVPLKAPRFQSRLLCIHCRYHRCCSHYCYCRRCLTAFNRLLQPFSKGLDKGRVGSTLKVAKEKFFSKVSVSFSFPLVSHIILRKVRKSRRLLGRLLHNLREKGQKV